MLFLGVLSTLLAVAAAQVCYTAVDTKCADTTTSNANQISDCNSQYGSIKNNLIDLQTYANANIESSFEFLLMSSYYGNYEGQREGFKKLHRKYSDKLWEDGIDLLKFIAKRGGSWNTNELPHFAERENTPVLRLREISSLAKALDTQKYLANEALRMHREATLQAKHDASIAHYIEEKFLEPQAQNVRDLSGYIIDVQKMLASKDPAVAMFLFDEYLKNSL